MSLRHPASPEYPGRVFGGLVCFCLKFGGLGGGGGERPEKE